MVFDDITQEIDYYNKLPVVFDGFMEDMSGLADKELSVICTARKDAIPEKKWVPSYEFSIMVDGEKAGGMSFRIGYTDSLYYGGQIGYEVDEAYRGKGYCARAVALLAHVAKFHGMEKLIISNNVENRPSARVCEKLGLRLVRVVDVPEWHDLYKKGERRFNIFEWDLANE
ncbi:MAG: GNAT family N-acetyltransferase [Defluviitaleaceae bacterium]|nr:GNAT family N-acetyltransferase [Defluviitaleaceae bacterium]